MIFEQWRNKDSESPTIDGLSSIDLIIYVQMKFTSCETFVKFLKNQYLVDQMRDISDEDAPGLFHSLRVLVVVDGYDEKKDHGDSFLKDLASFLPRSQVVLTTRPECINECGKIFRSRLSWELIGFEEAERNKFASNIFKLVEEDTKIRSSKQKKFKDYLRTRESCLEPHLKLPLTLALLIFLWLEKYGNPEAMNGIRTASQLYYEIFEMLKEKLIEIRSNLKTGLPNTEDVDYVISVLHEKAFDQLKADQLLLLTDESREVIEQSCENGINPVEIFSAYLACDSTSELMFSFLHRSQMEYYSACTITQNLATGRSLSEYFDMADKRKYKETFTFLAGCLKQEGLLTTHCAALVELCKAVASKDDYNYWFSLLNETESQNLHTSEMYDETMKKEMNSCLPKKWTLKVQTLIAGLNLLACCPCVQIAELELKFPSNDDLKNISRLKPSLERLKHARKTLQQEPKTDLKLNLGGHMEDSINFLSDPLVYFCNWCKVIDFTGPIKVDSVERLLHSSHVTVRVNMLDTFNKIAEQSSKMKNLKQLLIIVSFRSQTLGTESPLQMSHKTAKIDLKFSKLIDKNVQKTIKFVNDACPRPRSFNQVTISGSLSFDDGVEIVKGLQGVVGKKVYIESSKYLNEEEKVTLMATALEERHGRSTFMCEWNGDQLKI
ncbi:hypothetical protein FHG87_012032 [Trinorchestia longiramus]|nr:hypothetical protein FHG87_012032 [Trinorchestia longiramus]